MQFKILLVFTCVGALAALCKGLGLASTAAIFFFGRTSGIGSTTGFGKVFGLALMTKIKHKYAFLKILIPYFLDLKNINFSKKHKKYKPVFR